MNDIKLSSIVAMAENNVIGKDNDMPWHIPKDFRHFKRTTMGCPMIMGRKCFESLPGILPGRTHIVISRSQNDNPDVEHASSIEEAIEIGKNIAEQDNVKEAFIIGGGEIYKQTLPLIDRIYLTQIHKTFEGDTFFPEFNWDEWETKSEEPHKDEGGKPAFTILTLDRK